MQNVPYDRTYKGLPVIGGDFVVVVDAAGQVKYNSVAQTQSIGGLAVTPKLTASAAQAVARGQQIGKTSVEGTQLVVNALGTPRLAWETMVDGTNAEGPSRLSVDMDALTGAVLYTREHVLYGSGTSAWNGPNPVHIDTTGGGTSFSMTDPTIHNLSCQDYPTHATLTGTDDVSGNGNATSKETGCVDALFVAQTEFKMLAAWDGRNGMDGTGGVRGRSGWASTMRTRSTTAPEQVLSRRTAWPGARAYRDRVRGLVRRAVRRRARRSRVRSGRWSRRVA